jgi:hypothetical protein
VQQLQVLALGAGQLGRGMQVQLRELMIDLEEAQAHGGYR